MKLKVLRKIASLCLVGAVAASAMAGSAVTVKASPGKNISIEESEINQLLTGDLKLPGCVDGKPGASVTYQVDEKDSKYVTVEGNTLKVTRPYAGEGNYSFVLTATIRESGEEDIVEHFPLTIAEGVSDDSYAGYIYVSFASVDGYDVQQLHFFLSEDGLNWTALNGFQPVFEVGEDHAENIVPAGTHNYRVKEGTDLKSTASGDASVLFPFEGTDQGIRDPYVIRGSRKDGSDKDKVWILATDLNTMQPKYDGNLENHVVGNWGKTSTDGSTSLFIYETEDWVHWERRWVDVGAQIGAGAAWAPEAIYNPEKDNYLVYWSCRVEEDGYARNRLYCNETKDFKTFGPTKLYEQEPFYKNWGEVAVNSGYGNIDTSQLWVADGENPYGTLYRLVKDETNNHIELMGADTVLDPKVDYDASQPTKITPYTLGGKTYSHKTELAGLSDRQKAEVVNHWFEKNSVGNHFEKISQKHMEKYSGAYEGATMFKFYDRDEWCVMIDFYGDMNVRYEPYITRDLSDPDSIQKMSSGYGRTGGDVGTHGGMIPITAAEYNRLIDTYNADPTVENYHPIDYIGRDTRALEDTIKAMEKKLEAGGLDEAREKKLKESIIKARAMVKDDAASTREMKDAMEYMEEIIHPQSVEVSTHEVTLKPGESKTVTATPSSKNLKVIWKSADPTVATVEDGEIKGVTEGSTFVFAKAGKQGMAVIRVAVK